MDILDNFNLYYWTFYGCLAIIGIIMVVRHERKKKARSKLDEEDIPDELD
jgi:hypothetical protein